MNMYTHSTYCIYICTHVRTSVYGRGRGLRGPVGVGWCVRDRVHVCVCSLLLPRAHTHTRQLQ